MATTIEEVQTDSSHQLIKGEGEAASKTDPKSLKKKKKKYKFTYCMDSHVLFPLLGLS